MNLHRGAVGPDGSAVPELPNNRTAGWPNAFGREDESLVWNGWCSWHRESRTHDARDGRQAGTSHGVPLQVAGRPAKHQPLSVWERALDLSLEDLERKLRKHLRNWKKRQEKLEEVER